MLIGLVIALAAFGMGIAASVLAAQKTPIHTTRRREVPRPAGYRAPAPTAADVAAAPLSAELLDKVLAATDRGEDPHTIDVVPGPRTRLAIAFAAAAIAAVRGRTGRAKYAVAVAAGLFVMSLFIPVPSVLFLLWFGSFGSLIVAAGMFAEVWRARASLVTLALSDAPPADVAATLRRIAHWPEAQGDPLTGWPAYE